MPTDTQPPQNVFFCIHWSVTDALVFVQLSNKFIMSCAWVVEQHRGDGAQPAQLPEGQLPGSGHRDRQAVCAASAQKETQVRNL